MYQGTLKSPSDASVNSENEVQVLREQLREAKGRLEVIQAKQELMEQTIKLKDAENQLLRDKISHPDV